MSRVKLGDVAIERKETTKNSDGMPTVGLEHLIPGQVILDNWSEEASNTFTKVFRKGDVLFGRRRAYLKKASVASIEGICSGDITVITAKQNKICPELLPFVIQNDALFDYAIENSAGSLSPRVKWQHLKEYEFELPEMNKQIELADILWSINKTQKAYENLIKMTDGLVKSQFIEMLDGSKERNCLGDYVIRCTPQRCGDKSLPVLSVTKEKSIVFQEDRFDTVVSSENKSNYIIVPKGYIVQGIHIDEGNFGLQDIVEKGIVSPAYKLWKIYNPNVIPKLLEFYLRSDRAISYYRRNFQGTTVARRQTIKQEDLLSMPINFPSIDIQMQFYNYMKQSDKSKFELEKALLELKATYKRIIKENLG